MKILSKSKNGKVFLCEKCDAIHIEFLNFGFNFNKKQYNHFKEYLNTIDADYWEERNKESLYRRKIVIPLGKNNFSLLLNKLELNEFKNLLCTIQNKRDKFKYLVYKELKHYASIN